jgi:hypothetical protein
MNWVGFLGFVGSALVKVQELQTLRTSLQRSPVDDADWRDSLPTWSDCPGSGRIASTF